MYIKSCINKFCILLICSLFICLIGNMSATRAKMIKKTIMIDLDGVLDNYEKYSYEIPSIKDGAKEFVKKLSNDYELILFTTRPPKQAVIWLQENKIDKYFKDVTNVKTPAYIYIDDRALKFEGDFDKTLEKIEKFNVYWK